MQTFQKTQNKFNELEQFKNWLRTDLLTASGLSQETYHTVVSQYIEDLAENLEYHLEDLAEVLCETQENTFDMDEDEYEEVNPDVNTLEQQEDD